MSSNKVFEDYNTDEIISFQLGEYIIDIPKELKDEVLVSNYHLDCEEREEIYYQNRESEEMYSKHYQMKGHYAMENFVKVTDEELNNETSDPEKELEKLLSLEINNVDLINENLKLKNVLKRAKVGMWKEFINLKEDKEVLELNENKMKEEIGN